MIYKFYDTSSLLIRANDWWMDEDTTVVISTITLQELENIKSSGGRDFETKRAAAQLLRSLVEHSGAYEVVIYMPSMVQHLLDSGYELSNDLKILACASWWDYNIAPDNTIFVTNDLALYQIANIVFGEDSIESVEPVAADKYTGYKVITLKNDEEFGKFYADLDWNHFNLLINQYLILKNAEGVVVDRFCWTGETHRRLNYDGFKSKYFGLVRPMKGDEYQQIAADSLESHNVSMLCGKPGSGKTYLAFGYLFSMLEKGKIDRIVVFCNPVVAKNAAKLGFYPGTRDEKLLGSQVGAVLSSKLGDQTEVERLIQAGQLVLLPAGDARGYEVPQNSGVYIMEAQNLTTDLLRLLLQRVSDGCKVIVDGDYEEQVDMDVYAGNNNGMRRMSEIFRGSPLFAQVELKNIYRSPIAALADNMR